MVKVIKVKLKKSKENLVVPYQAHGMDHTDKWSSILNVKDGIVRESKVLAQLLSFKITWISPRLSSGHRGQTLCITSSLGFGKW